jgi:hypothetical protein
MKENSFCDKDYAVMRRGRGSTIYVTDSYYSGKENVREENVT